ncbi:hypothetical protein [Kribbella sp. CA-293567]|uniref:hypothetical protein n=1 Tax=Kribbella sp. CA-293567 TaxID=3002436 RepID=UPI0022DD07FF|nr:hypothetical protein [Kribbella sp. CA-293567]WBQ05085.1 hypothetical protein OX958_34690 [Kribbella sp. CA-293567]
MNYQQFDAEYRQVLEASKAGLSTAGLQAEIDRLRALVDGIEDPADRQDAADDIAMLDDLVTRDDTPRPRSVARSEAFAAYQAATSKEGTPAERIARAERGIEEIERIVAAADPAESDSIAGLTESLHMLIGALRSDLG